MTVPLMVLAVGAIAAGYVGIPAVLGDSVGIPTAIEHYLEPSFVAGSAAHAEEVHQRDGRNDPSHTNGGC